MTPEHHILIVEDDAAIRESLEFSLKSEGYRVQSVADAETAEVLVESQQHDLILLDIMLPGRSGYELCQRLRQKGLVIPILILSALNEESSRVIGLDLGADDFVSKPFSLDELLARIRALIRRSGFERRAVSSISFGRINVDFERHVVKSDNTIVHLPLKAVQVLKYLVEHAEESVSRDDLLKEVWGYTTLPMTRTVDNQIALLRSELEDDSARPQFIQTVHGVGYKFTRESERDVSKT